MHQRKVISIASAARLEGALVHLTQVEGCATALLARQRRDLAPRHKLVVVCADESAVEQTKDDLHAVDPGARVVVLPHPEASPYDPVRPDRALALVRAAALTSLDQGDWDYLVATASAWLKKTVPPQVLRRHTHHLSVGEGIQLAELCQKLAEAGYQRMPLAEDPGTLSVRGDILDVWPPSSDLPVRVELEFEHIVRLSHYDPETQRTVSVPQPKTEILFGPTREFVFGPDDSASIAVTLRRLADEASIPSSRSRALIEDITSGRQFMGASAYLPTLGPLVGLAERMAPGTVVLFDDAARIVERTAKDWEQASVAFEMRGDVPHFPPQCHFLDETELDASLERLSVFALHRQTLAGPPKPGFSALLNPPLQAVSVGTESQQGLMLELADTRKRVGRDAGLQPLVQRLSEWQEEGLRVVLTTRNETQLDRLRTLLSHRSVDTHRSDALLWSKPSSDRDRWIPGVHLCVSTLSRGVVAKNDSLVLVTEEEIFGRRRHSVSRRAARAVQNALDDLRSLSPGDLVVHVEHGIGRYLGLEHRVVGDIQVELLAVEYASGDRLLLPVYRLNQIQKFSGEGTPKLDKLGGTSFAKTKSRARKRVRILADQLLRLYAERRAVRRRPLSPPDDDFADFEASFPYEETSDQAAAIADVVSDLQKDQVMDRLVCGDVGFGKTEVALRAAFLVAREGRQVAILCPTTVLAEQHARTVQARFADTGLEIATLSRFVPPKRQDAVLSDLKLGRIDVIVGTHRLLSKDVIFKDLGLLVIDEEQRFGVAHKERILEMRKAVDVLTLTATPIPRTLSLAIGGIRDMSVINTAPQERRAIRTFASRFDEQLIRDAIGREIARGGQVFYVYNRVEGIYERASLIQRLLPGVKVAVGHGKLSERQLEKTMYGFVQGEFDVLCATAIIESGLDIPRANTIIVDRADLFGLSQLYQLRGRVGRASERGYCYLLVPPDAELSAEARARIETLERYTELGSGFHVATMDMELRGTGELLGAEQSGFMEKIGFELFARMLEEATAELNGEPYLAELDPELSLDIEALLPESYIDDIGVRLSLYKRLASAESEEEVAQLSDEIADRFGAPPREALAYFEVMRLKTRLRKVRAVSLHATKRSASLALSADTPLRPEQLVQLVSSDPKSYQLSPDGRLKRTDRDGRISSGLSHATLLLDELDRIPKEPHST